MNQFRELISIYRNGSYLCKTWSDGTKEYIGKSFKSDFPDTIDIKITNRCNHGCPWCHESSVSNPNDKDNSVLVICEKLKNLPGGIELAIGGGNILLYPEIIPLLEELTKMKFILNITLSVKDFLEESSFEKLQSIISLTILLGIGISIDSIDKKNFNTLENVVLPKLNSIKNNITYVYHVIVGIMPIKEFIWLCQNSINKKILILGYKSFGRGINFQGSRDIENWKQTIKRILYYKNRKNLRSYGISDSLSLSFDNLAIEQLGIKESLSKESWDRFYMGDEFSHSMYVDAVKGEFAPTSRDLERISWDDIDILDYFKKYSKE